MAARAKTLDWALAQTRKRPTHLGKYYGQLDRVTHVVFEQVIAKANPVWKVRLDRVSYYNGFLHYHLSWDDPAYANEPNVHCGYGFYIGRANKQAWISPYPGAAAMLGLPEEGWAIDTLSDVAIKDTIRMCLNTPGWWG